VLTICSIPTLSGNKSAIMPSAEARGSFLVKDLLVLIPLFGSVLAMTWEVGSFIPTGGFTYFSLSEHLLAAVNALPYALATAVVLLVGPLFFFPSREKAALLRIPGKATTLSGAWRPRDPVDDDRGGARA
jgi:hypothetical protein